MPMLAIGNLIVLDYRKFIGLASRFLVFLTYIVGSFTLTYAYFGNMILGFLAFSAFANR